MTVHCNVYCNAQYKHSAPLSLYAYTKSVSHNQYHNALALAYNWEQTLSTFQV